MPFLSGKFANSNALSHDKSLREGSSQATKQNHRLLLGCAVAYGQPQAGDLLISFFLPAMGGQGSEQRHSS